MADVRTLYDTVAANYRLNFSPIYGMHCGWPQRQVFGRPVAKGQRPSSPTTKGKECHEP